MRELFDNPVTVIAIGLAIFFTIMALAKRWSYRRSIADKSPDEKPYQITDPYQPPPVALATPPVASAESIPGPTPKVFRQFGSRTGSEDADEAPEYMWE